MLSTHAALARSSGGLQQGQHRRTADELDQAVGIHVVAHLAPVDRVGSRVRTAAKRSVNRALTRPEHRGIGRTCRRSARAARRRTTGLVNTSRAAATIARRSAAMSPGGVSIAVGVTGNAASCTSSALLDQRRYSAVLVVPARSATAAIVTPA